MFPFSSKSSIYLWQISQRSHLLSFSQIVNPTLRILNSPPFFHIFKIPLVWWTEPLSFPIMDKIILEKVYTSEFMRTRGWPISFYYFLVGMPLLRSCGQKHFHVTLARKSYQKLFVKMWCLGILFSWYGSSFGTTPLSTQKCLEALLETSRKHFGMIF